MFPRQSGKNELQAQLEAYLLLLLSQTDAEMVKVSPTWKPQAQNAMRRLERTLSANLLTRDLWKKESGYIYRVGRARIYFFSGNPEANIVGATASTLLEVDEAQDVLPEKFDKDIAPMAAATNATRVFFGTAWTSDTLLARELRAARKAEAEDGLRRAFVLTAEDVGKVLPSYCAFVDDQVARLGRSHPMVRTQFFSEEIEAGGGMFPPERRSLMQGGHPALDRPQEGASYAFLIDVGGEDAAEDSLASEGLQNPARDLTALTIMSVRLAGLEDPLQRKPSYRVVHRCQWQGISHNRLYEQMMTLIARWQPQQVVVDATGVGAGLASFLSAALPGRVKPFVFTSASKSKLGWDFLGVIETGRFQDYCLDDANAEARKLQDLFMRQAAACEHMVRSGPAHHLAWGVPNGRREADGSGWLHDDLLISAAMCALLDELPWSTPLPGVILQARDPLEELDEGF
jgi:Terminase RNaseH-like domain